MTTAHRSYFAQHVGARTHHRHGEIYNDIEPCSVPPASAATTNKPTTAQPTPAPAPSGPKYIKRRQPIPPPDDSYSYLPPPPQMSPRANDGSAFLNTKGWWASTANETPVMAGFYFRRRRERVNWRLLSSMNIDQIMKEVDIKALQDIMENLTFCDIDGEDLRYPDQNIVKLIKLAQLTIEYLLHSQQYLLNHRRALTTQTENLGRNLAQLRAEHAKQGAEVASLKKETRVLRKSMYAYQLMTKLPGGIGQPAPTPAHGAAYYRCPQCEKVFVSQAYVECHLQRRHPESAKPPAPPLKPAEAPPAATAAPEPKGMTKEEVMEQMERVNGKIADVESHLRAEMERKVEMEIASRQAVLDEALKREKLKHEEELREMRASMRREQEEERLAIQKERDELAALKDQLQRDREANSKFGVLEDDDESSSFGADMFDNDKNEKTQQEIEELKTAFATSKRETQAEVESRLAIANAQLQAVQRELREEQARKAAQEEAHRRAREQDQATNAAEIDRVKGSLEKLKGQLSATVSVDGHGPPGPPARFQGIDSGSESERPATPPQPAASDKLDWEGALKLLATHSQLPLPTSAWVKTLFPHDPAAFLAQRAAIAGEVEARLARLGVPAARIEREWGTGSGVEAECKRAYAQLDSERSEKARTDPLYERMRAFLGEAVENAAGKSRKGSKPPPIVTARDDKPPLSAAVGPVSASAGAGRRPPTQVRGRHGPRPRTTRPAHMPEGFSAANRFLRRPSAMPPLSATTPTLGGWKFPSLRRAPRSGANGGQPPSADINWDNDSSEFTGSDEDETIPSARSDRKRGNSSHYEPPTPRSGAASHRRRSLSEGGFRAGGGGVARRGSTASRRPSTTTATAAARLQSVPPSPSVFQEGFSRLSRALSLTTAGAKDIFRKSAPASFPRRQPVARRDSFRERQHDSAPGSPTKLRVAKESSPRRRSRAAEADSYDDESDETYSSSGESAYSLRQPKSATVQARPASPTKQSVAARVLRTNNTGRHPPQQSAPPAPRGGSKPDPLAAVTDKLLSKKARSQKPAKQEKYVVSDIEDDDSDLDAGRSSIADSDDSRQWNPRPLPASYENNRSMSAVAEESEESASQAHHAMIDRDRKVPKPVTSLRHQPPAATAKAAPAPVLVVRPLQSAAGRSAASKQPPMPAASSSLRAPAPTSKKTESEFDISSFMSDSSAEPPAPRQPTGKAAAAAAGPAPLRKMAEDDINLDDFENFSDIMTDDDSKVGRNSSVGAK
ncbi:Zinc finger protein dzip1 [Geranomyces variabilis]|nr:Zinc finger protein dzip1 [Geranomyces variabilis]